jgi:TRAP-type C4-dicarboxylate transport system permease small subunit
MRVLDALSSLVVLLFFGLIAWVLFSWGVRIKDSGEVSETLKIIYYPFIYCTAVGFSSLTFTLFLDVLKSITRKAGSERP